MDAATGSATRPLFANTPSQPTLSDLQKAMLDATTDCIKVLSVDGKLLTMNRAGCLALNVSPESGFGMEWLPLLPEDVHTLGRIALRQAAAGSNASFPGRSESDDGVRHWDNLLTPVADSSGRVTSILCVSRDVTVKTRLAAELEATIQREQLLAREMQHRVKNVFALVSGLITIAEKESAEEGGSRPTSQILRDKLQALARASDAAFADASSGDARLLELESLVGAVLQPYGAQCRWSGERTQVSRNINTTLVLFLHELATNAVKYGALSNGEGNIVVSWTLKDAALNLTWREAGGPAVRNPPSQLGFGSEMVDRLARSAGGEIDRAWLTEGLEVTLRLPNSSA